ncbi:multidrug ABC transporter permease [Campylobacter sp. MIT 99-7217]|uniref:ABC transporter permease n=1 Tax=Campylobacter sp. MIT 99-7217 TaxID=535091 RepID=UPI0011595EC9|nr:ABC transporter permease [Campylobacter sp. MIT 99-7217]TQR31823.1 multidrug ABC transporter permease [Campylobacter sp. MIT 99-7217]
MRAFNAFVKKEFFHIFRDTRTMLILILMPIIQILLFGFALSTEVSGVKFGVLDLSKTSLSTQIIEKFAQNEYFEFAKNIRFKDEIATIFNDDKTDLLIIFGEDFKQNNAKIELLIDGSDPNRASTINIYANNVLNSFLTEKNLSFQSPLEIATTLLFNPQGKSAYNFVPGLLGLILMLICAMMTSISIVREKEYGSMQILLVSPIKPILIIFAKIVPYFALSCLSLILVLLVCVFALDLKIAGNIFLLFAFCMLYIALVLSIGLFVSNLAKTQIASMLVCGMLFMMPIMMFSGMLFPIESMPLILQYLSHIIPTKWFILGLKKIMIEGLGVGYCLKEISILGLMFVAILFISLKSFKVRL